MNLELLSEWRERLNLDHKKAMDRSEPVPRRLWRPSPKADDLIKELSTQPRLQSLVADLRAGVSELSRLTEIPQANWNDLSISDELCRLRRGIGNLIEHASRSEFEQHVTLDQMAVLVNRSKKTLERWLKGGKLPEPDVEGGGGKPHEWKYKNVREKLSELADRQLPEKYPSLRK